MPRPWQQRDLAEDTEVVNWVLANELGTELGTSIRGVKPSLEFVMNFEGMSDTEVE